MSKLPHRGNWRGSCRQASTSQSLTSDVRSIRLCLSLLPMTEVVPQVVRPVTYKSLRAQGGTVNTRNSLDAGQLGVAGNVAN